MTRVFKTTLNQKLGERTVDRGWKRCQ